MTIEEKRIEICDYLQSVSWVNLVGDNKYPFFQMLVFD